MELSKLYILQCRKCPEIQEKWHEGVTKQLPYHIIYNINDKSLDYYDHVLEYGIFDMMSELFWIPTQEQTQSLLKRDSLKLKQVKDLQLLSLMRIGIQRCGCNTYLNNCTLNEMWLMYYMYEIHKKKWNHSNNCWEKL